MCLAKYSTSHSGGRCRLDWNVHRATLWELVLLVRRISTSTRGTLSIAVVVVFQKAKDKLSFFAAEKKLEPASFSEAKSKTKLALALNYIDFVLFLFIFVFVFFGAATHIWVPSLETSQQQTHSEQLRCRRQNTHLPMRRDNWRRLKSYDFKEEKLPKVGESCVCCLGYPQNKMAAASNSCFSCSKTRLIHTSLQQFWW